MAAPAIVATFGCFSYSRLSGDRIRLHFENADADGHSSLGDRPPGAATGRPDRPLRACEANAGSVCPGGWGVVAVQSRCVSPSVSDPVSGDRSRDPSVSEYAPVGPIPGSTWGGQENMARPFLERLECQRAWTAWASASRFRCSQRASVREFLTSTGSSRVCYAAQTLTCGGCPRSER